MKPSLIVWDLETVPDLGGFAAANDLVGKSDVEVRAPTKTAIKQTLEAALSFRLSDLPHRAASFSLIQCA